MGEIQGTLEGAYEALEEHGWCQDHLINPGGQVCLEAAIYLGAGVEIVQGELVTPLSPRFFPFPSFSASSARVRACTALAFLRSVLFNRTDGQSYSLSYWNDKPERTVEDVKLLLKHGIEEAEGKGV